VAVVVAGVVDEDLDRAVLGSRPLDRCLQSLDVPEVEGNETRARMAARGDPLDDCL